MQALKLFMVPPEKSQGFHTLLSISISHTLLSISILVKFSGEEAVKLIQRSSCDRKWEQPHNFWMTVTRLINIFISLRFSAF